MTETSRGIPGGKETCAHVREDGVPNEWQDGESAGERRPGQFKGQGFEACTRVVLIDGRRNESSGSVERTCDQRLSTY